MNCLLPFIILIFSLSEIDAQFINKETVQIIVKGVITDVYTGEPCEAIITIKNKDGKKFKIKSNFLDGSYQQVLNSGESYEFTFLNFDVLKKVDTLFVENSNKYLEQKADFKVQKLRAGLKLFSEKIFQEGSDEIIDSIKNTLKNLEEIMLYNRSVKFEFSVNAHDTYTATLRTDVQNLKQKGKKNKKIPSYKELKQQSLPDSRLVAELVDIRLRKLHTLTEQFKRFQYRLSYKPDYTLGEPQFAKEKQDSNPDFIIMVSEIKNAFE